MLPRTYRPLHAGPLLKDIDCFSPRVRAYILLIFLEMNFSSNITARCSFFFFSFEGTELSDKFNSQRPNSIETYTSQDGIFAFNLPQQDNHSLPYHSVVDVYICKVGLHPVLNVRRTRNILDGDHYPLHPGAKCRLEAERKVILFI